MNMQPILPNYSGRKDGRPDHVAALAEYYHYLHTAHIGAWEDHMARLEWLRVETEYMERYGETV